MPIVIPEIFRHEELTINAEIQAVVDGRQYDMTGRRYFYARLFNATEEDTNQNDRFPDGLEVTSTHNFRQNIGFGITNIDIDISTSLQPIIEITFKDLYGNTVFGGNNPENIDYSVLFNWPPPKFLFSYKGYLGKQVSYMLSIKKIDTNFVAQDGSYDIKVTFVPHQWGFFADIPFEFLKAVKGLKSNANLITSQNIDGKAGYSVVDLMELGFEVQQSYKQISSKYDDIYSKMIDYKSDIVGAIRNRGFEETTGNVDGDQIPDFISMSISESNASEFKNLGENVADLNLYLFSKIILNGSDIGPYINSDISVIQSLGDTEKRLIANRVLEAIDSNLNQIENQIQRERLSQNKDKLRKLTISEIFNQIASDSAYLMGRILEAAYIGMSEPKGSEGDGNSGYDDAITQSEQVVGRNVTVDRKQNRIDHLNDGKISGRGYPVVINSNGKEELPALPENLDGADLGIENVACEMSFVREFIEALKKGISEVDEKRDIINNVQSGRILARISNLEALSSNPYNVLSYKSFAQNILARSAIAGWFTKSDDPNSPGATIVSNSDIIALANHDFQNVNDSTISALSSEHLSELKRFCMFWDNLLPENANTFLNYNKTEAFDVNLFEGQILKDDPYQPTSLFDEILDFTVVIDPGSLASDINSANNNSELQEVLDGANDADASSVREIVQPLLGNGILQNIDPTLMAGNRFQNNGNFYIKPNISVVTPGIPEYILVFVGNQAEALRSLKNTPANASDSVVYIDSIFVNGEISESVKEFNTYVQRGLAYNYSTLSDSSNLPDFNSESFDNLSPSQLRQRLKWRRYIGDENSVDDLDLSPNDFQDVSVNNLYTSANLSNTPIAYIPFYNETSSSVTLLSEDNADGTIDADSYKRIAFDLWSNREESQHQRIYIKHFCKLLLEKINQKERDDQARINQIFGRNQSGEEIIYRQFKTLYEQWSTLATSNEVKNGKLTSQNVEEFQGLAERMMREYGGSGTSGTDGLSGVLPNKSPLPDAGSTEGVFVYDFPLQRIAENNSNNNQVLRNIDVRNSVINIDPLFDFNTRTTVLNMFQSLAQKNNFMFIPIPGYANYLDVEEIYSPKAFSQDQKIVNFFHVLFIPTPETDVLKKNAETFSSPIEFSKKQEKFDVNALEIKYGSTENNIIKNINVSTQDNKVTAESAVNIQRLVDSENRNRTVTKDCSILNVFAGRSYTASVDVLGNAQVFPMQFFFVRNLPIFDGLYQILKVKHSITPNNFETSFEGIKMRFSIANGYGGVHPITIETLEDEFGVTQSSNVRRNPAVDFAPVITYLPPNDINAALQIGTNMISVGTALEELKEVIGLYESQNDYNIANTGSDGLISNAQVSTMTFDEIQQRQQIPDQQNRDRIFAAGRFQVIPDTLNTAKRVLGFVDSDRFSPENQERVGDYLLFEKRPKVGRYIDGTNSGTAEDLTDAINHIGYEWASMPVVVKSNGDIVGNIQTGAGQTANYGDLGANPNNAKVSVMQMAQILIRTRQRYSGKDPVFIPSYF